MVQHMSDCALHNGPALPVGPCDCKAEEREAATINAFLDLCAPSLDPESMGNVERAVLRLCENRNIDKGTIYPWGISAPQGK